MSDFDKGYRNPWTPGSDSLESQLGRQQRLRDDERQRDFFKNLFNGPGDTTTAPPIATGGGRRGEGSITGAIAHIAVFLLVVFFCIGAATAGDGPATDAQVGGGLIFGLIAYGVLKALKIVDVLVGLAKVVIWGGVILFVLYVIGQMA